MAAKTTQTYTYTLYKSHTVQRIICIYFVSCFFSFHELSFLFVFLCIIFFNFSELLLSLFNNVVLCNLICTSLFLLACIVN